jgi:hypothetical protein
MVTQKKCAFDMLDNKGLQNADIQVFQVPALL